MKFFVETGLFSNEKFARSQKEMLIRKGYDCRIEKVKKERKRYFSVRTGNYDSRSDASKIVDSLNEKERLRGKILMSED